MSKKRYSTGEEIRKGDVCHYKLVSTPTSAIITVTSTHGGEFPENVTTDYGKGSGHAGGWTTTTKCLTLLRREGEFKVGDKVKVEPDAKYGTARPLPYIPSNLSLLNPNLEGYICHDYQDGDFGVNSSPRSSACTVINKRYLTLIEPVEDRAEKKEKTMKNTVKFEGKQEVSNKCGMYYQSGSDVYLLGSSPDCNGRVHFAAISLRQGKPWKKATPEIDEAVEGLTRVTGKITIMAE